MPIDQDYSENVVLSGDFGRFPVVTPDPAADHVQFLDATDGATKRCLISAIATTSGQGTAVIDFGAFPGSSDATVTVTGQTAFNATTHAVQVWLRLVDSANHTADEHMLESIAVQATAYVTGTGFTIRAVNTSQLNEPLIAAANNRGRVSTATNIQHSFGASSPAIGGRGTRLHGQWNINWRWS